MGELSILLDDSSLHEVGISRIFEKENGVYIDLDDVGKECGLIESNNKLRSLFDEALKAFLSGRTGGMCLRPVPVSCSDGRNVNLFKLFWVVRKIGGYDLVCRKYLWGFVVKHCGLASGVSAFLKLIYVKYLKEFDQFLWDFKKETYLDIHTQTSRKLDLLLEELEPNGVLLIRKGVENKIEEGVLQLTYDENSKDAGLNRGGSATHLLGATDILGSKDWRSDNKYDDAKVCDESEKDLVTTRKRGLQEVTNEICVDAKQCLVENGEKASVIENSGFQISAKKFRWDIPNVRKNSESEANDGFCGLINDNNIMLSEQNYVEQGSDSQKLKKGSFSFTTLLLWTRNAAKHSDDPRIGIIPKCSNWENHVGLLALAIRKFRFLKKISKSRDNTSKRQMKVWTNTHTLCKECLPAHTKSGDKEKEKKSGPRRNKGRSRNQKQELDIHGIESRTKDTRIGSKYQVEVPQWTGKVCESDSKWLGTRIWSPEEQEEEEEEERKSASSLVCVGRGREESSCDCERKNSVECVRFHVAEKRFMLKTELGSLFFKWRFDRMGEEVSLSWTREEEDKFKQVVRSHATFLCNRLARMFPSKTREMLVSYYFNVYINQVRSYQNRETPTYIDSDNEEEHETACEWFGYKALMAPDSCTQICVENKQFLEFQ